MGLEQVLNARSVAVVGASKVPTKRGYQTIRTLLDEGYEGAIYPVNPKEPSIMGLKCYTAVSEIPGEVDVALIATPARTVPAVLEDCGKKGVKGAIILATGFGETGAKGKSLEGEVLKVAGRHHIRLIGPNTSGMINLKDNLNLVGLKHSPKGDIALLTQSGNMALTLITEAKLQSRKGFTYYVGVGNEADIRFHEYLEFFSQDPDTRTILMYVEGMREGRKFLQQAYKTTENKPVVLLKSGRSSTGKQSAGSHTGALAGMSEVAKGAFERAGIIVIENSDELFPAAESLSSLPPIKNNQIAILADGGGHATIAADTLTDLGVKIPQLEEKTQAKLRAILPGGATVRNPIDVAGGTDDNPAVFADCANIILGDPNVGGLLVVGLFGGYGIRFAESLSLIEEDAAHQIGKMVKRRKKAIIVHSLYNSEKPHSLDLLRYYGVPVYGSLDIACKCIGVLAEYGRYLKRYHAKSDFVLNWEAKAKPEGRQIIGSVYQQDRTALLEAEAKQLLRFHGAAVTSDALATTEDAAAKAAAAMCGKVVLKIASPDILHKSDAKGVRLNLSGKDQVKRAFREIIKNAKAYKANARIEGVLISPMVCKGIEVIIGTKIDDQFGPVIMYGLGGVMVEIIKDVSFRVLPISRRSAQRMIAETKSHPILDGVRGDKPYDKKALVNLLLVCSEIIEAYPQIQEMDLNPVIIHHEGLSIVDARILLNPRSEDKKEGATT
ncbi:acetate--CoA ligase family protein [Desulfosarcina sp.]|uniref:acetate--CoA ligase family protein n=1 Tax=Desulfosarcina sp. TaxID=2027861 RepID=UPI0029A20264|nr:acetate--CoA ligase family protein [Desulfosarcina sp.]MDX2451862.1 acetate--CoA ligase family protein [Desulfosarcina sp.]MDX2489644.1 acetate--CoA ligase family protein [Desulfosarcina sp.]